MDAIGLIGIDGLAAVAESADGFDVRATLRKLLSGEFSLDGSAFRRWLNAFADELKASSWQLLLNLSAPVAGSLLLRILLSKRCASDNGAALLCRLAVSAVLLRAFVSQRDEAEQLARMALHTMNAATPVLVGASSLAPDASAAVLSPLATLCAGAIENAMIATGLPLCSLAASIAAAGSLSGGFQLSRLFGLLRRVAVGAIGAFLAVFVGVMKLEGFIGASQESIGALAARSAVKGALPIIGGKVSSALGGLTVSASALKNAVGVSGILLLIAVCAKPLFRLAASTLAMRLASAIMEPFSDRLMSQTAAQFADAAELLVAISAGSMTLVALTIGACLTTAGSIV